MGPARDCFGISFGSFPKDPLIVVGDNFPDVHNPITILYMFNTSHMKFILNEHIRLDKKHLDVQGHFKAYLSNVVDVLGHLTFKLYKT